MPARKKLVEPVRLDTLVERRHREALEAEVRDNRGAGTSMGDVIREILETWIAANRAIKEEEPEWESADASSSG